MDNSFHRQENDTQQSTGSIASPHLFNSILDWLVSLIKLTDEEQKDAGIYLRDKNNE
jgi:hypothetical protein